MSYDYKLFKSFVLKGKNKISSNIVYNGSCAEHPASQTATEGSIPYNSYLLTIVSNQRLLIAPSFDKFYELVSAAFQSPGLSVVYSFYELQPTTHKLHIHAVVTLKKDNPNAFIFNFFPKVFKSGYKYDFSKINDENHMLNSFNYSKGIPQVYIRNVYTLIQKLHQYYNKEVYDFKTIIQKIITDYKFNFEDIEQFSPEANMPPSYDSETPVFEEDKTELDI